MFVYEIDGSVRQINVPSTLDIPPCKAPIQPIVPVLKENFGQVDVYSQMASNNSTNQCEDAHRNAFSNYIGQRINVRNKVYADQLMNNSSIQPWSQDSYYLLEDNHPYNSYLDGYNNLYDTNIGNGFAVRYSSPQDLNNMLSHMCRNKNKENWQTNQNWQASTSPSDLNY
ncbi:hypothetical protein CPAV1605_15 [seawater metagenome]|uniref:Uncharacterized protein n=1 Tax=seawater metagenome TaxID=1561972 RepID=A0A5E8CKL9_9ZZZZ